MIKQCSLSLLQTAINRTLALDPAMPSKINTLDGKALKMVVLPLEVHFYISFEQDALVLKSVLDREADAEIRSSPLGLIRLSLLPASKVRSLFNDTVTMSGDIEFAQQVKVLFDEIDIDWEGHLARFTGDVVAYQVGSLVRQGVAFKRQISSSLCHNLRDYLQEECRLFPTREETNDFFDDIDGLLLDVERLEAHIKVLAS